MACAGSCYQHKVKIFLLLIPVFLFFLQNEQIVGWASYVQKSLKGHYTKEQIKQTEHSIEQSKQLPLQSNNQTDNDNRPLMVIGILSKGSNYDTRKTVRMTWLSEVKRRNKSLPFKVVYRFLLDKQTKDLEIENEKHKDLFYLNAKSLGWGKEFGKKIYIWMKHIHEKWPNAILGVKMDDDAFPCVPQIFETLYKLKSDDLYYGWKAGNGSKIDRITRLDEMFLVLGKNLIRYISSRKYCRRNCPPGSLVELNFGGRTIGNVLSLYPSVDLHSDNQNIVHTIKHKFGKVAEPQFCNNKLLFHKASNENMQSMHAYNIKSQSD